MGEHKERKNEGIYGGYILYSHVKTEKKYVCKNIRAINV
jgi:hypothetical protein